MDSSSSSGDVDRWKLSMSKKGRSRSGRPQAMDAGGGSVLSRSYSAGLSSSRSATSPAVAGTLGSSSSSSSSAAAAAAASSSQQQQAAEPSSSSSSSRLSKKCVEAVKEHRARFYIVRRCVSMLVCWRDY